MRTVLTAGGLVDRHHIDPEGGLRTYVRLTVNREDARSPLAADPEWLQQHARLQIPKGHVEAGELLRTAGAPYFDARRTAEREVREELGIAAVAHALIGVQERVAMEYRNGRPYECVRKLVAVYAMQSLGPVPDCMPEELSVEVPVDERLPFRMQYPAYEGRLLNAHYKLGINADLLDVAAAEAQVGHGSRHD